MTVKTENQSLAKVTPITKGEAERHSQEVNIEMCSPDTNVSSKVINPNDVIIIKKDVYEHLSALYKCGADLLQKNGMLKVVE